MFCQVFREHSPALASGAQRGCEGNWECEQDKVRSVLQSHNELPRIWREEQTENWTNDWTEENFWRTKHRV